MSPEKIEESQPLQGALEGDCKVVAKDGPGLLLLGNGPEDKHESGCDHQEGSKKQMPGLARIRKSGRNSTPLPEKLTKVAALAGPVLETAVEGQPVDLENGRDGSQDKNSADEQRTRHKGIGINDATT